MAQSKLSEFSQCDAVYKIVNGHDISTSILVPKNASPGKHPLLVHFHGGFLMCGDKLLEDWWSTWMIQFAESKNAVILSPNYRLLPEANGLDILSDIRDFWSWVQTSLASELSKFTPGIEVDLSKILVGGESAGAYLTVQSPLLHPDLNINAVIAQYGMLDNTLPHFSTPGIKHLYGAPQQPESAVDDYLRSLPPNAVRTSSTLWELVSVIFATVQQGRLLGFLGHEDQVHPIKNLEKVEKVPPVWIIHGKNDSLVPIAASENFIEKLKQTHAQTPLLYTVQPGEHGFDGAMTMDESWVKEGCAWLEQFWP